MRAVVAESFGGPEVLAVRDVPTPVPGPGQVRIQVLGAGLNPVDTWNRKDGSWAGISAPVVLGYDVSGTVDVVGDGVRPDLVGTPVMAMTAFPRGAGGCAEYVVVDEPLVAPLERDVDLLAAASVPLAAGTAFEVLGLLQPAGPRMLVIGASGGVGLFLLQLAAAAGMHVVGLGRQQHHERMRACGASACVDYRDPDAIRRAAAAVPDGTFDSAADLVGGPLLAQAQPHVRDDGHLAAIATPGLDVDRLIDANQTFHGVLIRDNGPRLRQLGARYNQGQLRAHVAHVLPLEQAAQAHELVDSGEAGGKVVLTP
ncbi:MAG: NADP-dependent oxidoreductase [Actinomycetota bacterium]|nr:NADP-dependent oxidoreductase [Actinomycetota bacterium]MDH5277937.1 NADP-dependent oxidoreductase [Actinomycetota bacterium]